jgi:hypothetical protein
MQKRRFHSQNAGFEMSAPVDIGVKILAGTDVSPSCRKMGLLLGGPWRPHFHHQIIEGPRKGDSRQQPPG